MSRSADRSPERSRMGKVSRPQSWA